MKPILMRGLALAVVSILVSCASYGVARSQTMRDLERQHALDLALRDIRFEIYELRLAVSRRCPALGQQ